MTDNPGDPAEKRPALLEAHVDIAASLGAANAPLVATPTMAADPGARASHPRARSSASERSARTTGPIALFSAVAALLAVFFLFTRGGAPLTFSPQGFVNVGQTFAPLLAIAAFVERAVEVVISTWRDAGACALEGAQLDDYRLKTRHYAYGVSLFLALSASIVGVRAVASLVDATSLGDLSARQHLAFTIFDVVLTSFLISGGSNGIHQIVTTITTFLDTSKDKMAS